MLPRSDTAVRVLAIGPCIAVLVACAGASGEERDTQATAALRAVTNDPGIVIARRPSGRPRLLPPHPELGVSLSRRHGLLLAGYSPHGAVGVDLEVAAPGLDAPRLAADHFSPAEARAIANAATPTSGLDLFLRLWVAKEASLKAAGRGIYDGAEEPCLAAHLTALTCDAAVIALPAGSRVPALRVAVARVPGMWTDSAYCALALVDS